MKRIIQAAKKKLQQFVLIKRKNDTKLDKLKKILIKKHSLEHYSFYTFRGCTSNAYAGNYIGPYLCPVCKGKGDIKVFCEENILDNFEDTDRCGGCSGSGILYLYYGNS